MILKDSDLEILMVIRWATQMGFGSGFHSEILMGLCWDFRLGNYLANQKGFH